jgi:hypothetical protein
MSGILASVVSKGFVGIADTELALAKLNPAAEVRVLVASAHTELALVALVGIADTLEALAIDDK